MHLCPSNTSRLLVAKRSIMHARLIQISCDNIPCILSSWWCGGECCQGHYNKQSQGWHRQILNSRMVVVARCKCGQEDQWWLSFMHGRVTFRFLMAVVAEADIWSKQRHRSSRVYKFVQVQIFVKGSTRSFAGPTKGYVLAVEGQMKWNFLEFCKIIKEDYQCIPSMDCRYVFVARWWPVN